MEMSASRAGLVFSLTTDFEQALNDALEDLAQTPPPSGSRLSAVLHDLANSIALNEPFKPGTVDELNKLLGDDLMVSVRFNVPAMPHRSAEGILELEFQDFGNGDEDTWFQAMVQQWAAPCLALLSTVRSRGSRPRRCLDDGRWFTPTSRSSGAKFCSTRCRNRFNYRVREEKTFQCHECGRTLPLPQFSGIARDQDKALVPCGFDELSPLCIEDASKHASVRAYLSAAEMLDEKIVAAEAADRERTRIRAAEANIAHAKAQLERKRIELESLKTGVTSAPDEAKT
jgi:hypothetical protein